MAQDLKKELHKLIGQNETIFDFINEKSLDGLWFWDLENALNIWMNSSFCELLGFDSQESLMESRTWKNFNEDEQLVSLLSSVKALATQDTFYQELYFPHKTGLKIWLNARCQVLKNNEETPTRLLITFQDISNKKDKSSKELYQFITENTADIIRYQTPTGQFNYVSPNIEELTGYTPEEYQNFSPLENVYPEDHDRLKKVVEDFAKGKKSSKVEYRLYHKNGDIIWVESRIKAIRNDAGQPVSLLSSTNNISLRKAAEKKLLDREIRYRQLVETAVDAIYLINEKGIVIDTNHEATVMLEKNKNDIIGQTVQVIDPNFNVESFIAFWSEVPYNESRTFETTHVNKAGKVIPIEISGKKYLFDDKTFYYGIARDISERKKHEKYLNESEAKLKNIIENSTNMFYAHTAENELTFVSPQIKTVLGYTPEEAMRKWTDFATKSPINVKGLKHTEKAIKTGKRQPTYELELLRKDGRKIIVEAREAPVIDNGKVIGIVGSLVDITERIEAENKIKQQNEEYEALNEELRQTNNELFASIEREQILNDRYEKSLEATDDGIWDWNIEANTVHYSDGWFKLLGIN